MAKSYVHLLAEGEVIAGAASYRTRCGSVRRAVTEGDGFDCPRCIAGNARDQAAMLAVEPMSATEKACLVCVGSHESEHGLVGSPESVTLDVLHHRDAESLPERMQGGGLHNCGHHLADIEPVSMPCWPDEPLTSPSVVLRPTVDELKIRAATDKRLRRRLRNLAANVRVVRVNIVARDLTTDQFRETARLVESIASNRAEND